MQMNKVYSLQDFTVKEESSNYRSNTGNSKNIIIGPNSIFKEISDSTIRDIPFNFRSLQDIEKMPDKTIIGKIIYHINHISYQNLFTPHTDVCMSYLLKPSRRRTGDRSSYMA